MKPYLQMAMPERTEGSYYRRDIKTDILYGHFRYGDIVMTASRISGKMLSFTDEMAKQMCAEGLIDSQTLSDYEQAVAEAFALVTPYDDMPVESIAHHIHEIRRDKLGVAAMEQYRQIRASATIDFAPQALNQDAKKAPLFENPVIFGLCDSAMLPLMQEDLRRASQAYVLCSEAPGHILPTREVLEGWLGTDLPITYLPVNDRVTYHPELQQAIDNDKASLFFYGEEGFLYCRSLKVDAMVYAKPKGFYPKALTGTLGAPQDCLIYVPKGFDITPYVPLTDRTRLSYWQLVRLWQDHGDQIYQMPVETLYETYPQYFLNIYETHDHCPEAAEGYPIALESTSMAEFDAQRDRAIKAYLDGFEDISYYATYFDENLREQPICYRGAEKQNGILVHAVRVKKSEQARVVSCGKTSLRQKFAREGRGQTALLSNFLFFLTPKLGRLYNELRADRPMEQADAAAGHLDYMLSYENGKRKETFPLFGKSCIAMKQDGSFLFFNFRLGGGSVQVADRTIRWETENVDTETDPIRIYTPYTSVADGDADRNTYRKLVGQDRVNLVILQDKLCSLRYGDVVMPSVGVVISLEAKTGLALMETLGLQSLGDGYYDVSGLELSVNLDAPEGIEPQVWQQVQWAYGGGLSLILDGEGLCDHDQMDAWFQKEGWMSPLSRQTQESSLHTLVKHPRTALGVTENGDTVLLVYSGRTWRSTGADYREMIAIARSLFPDIRSLMNMDGGGSAVLGLVIDGSFMELSCPSTSANSTVGMTRPVNTVLYIPIA